MHNFYCYRMNFLFVMYISLNAWFLFLDYPPFKLNGLRTTSAGQELLFILSHFPLEGRNAETKYAC